MSGPASSPGFASGPPSAGREAWGRKEPEPSPFAVAPADAYGRPLSSAPRSTGHECVSFLFVRLAFCVLALNALVCAFVQLKCFSRMTQRPRCAVRGPCLPAVCTAKASATTDGGTVAVHQALVRCCAPTPSPQPCKPPAGVLTLVAEHCRHTRWCGSYPRPVVAANSRCDAQWTVPRRPFCRPRRRYVELELGVPCLCYVLFLQRLTLHPLHLQHHLQTCRQSGLCTTLTNWTACTACF